MPSNYVKKVSKMYNISVKKLEKYWNRAINIAKRRFRLRSKKEFSDKHWSYVMSVFNRMLSGIKKERGIYEEYRKILEGMMKDKDLRGVEIFNSEYCFYFVNELFKSKINSMFSGLTQIQKEDIFDYVVDNFYRYLKTFKTLREVLDDNVTLSDFISDLNLQDRVKRVLLYFCKRFANSYYLYNIKDFYLYNYISPSKLEKVVGDIKKYFSDEGANEFLRIFNYIYEFDSDRNIYCLKMNKLNKLNYSDKEKIEMYLRKIGFYGGKKIDIKEIDDFDINEIEDKVDVNIDDNVYIKSVVNSIFDELLLNNNEKKIFVDYVLSDFDDDYVYDKYSVLIDLDKNDFNKYIRKLYKSFKEILDKKYFYIHKYI